MGKDIDADGHELVNSHIVLALIDLWGEPLEVCRMVSAAFGYRDDVI
jgi:hypothetical protein